MIEIVDLRGKEYTDLKFLKTAPSLDVSTAVAKIIFEVKEKKDEALKKYTLMYDGVQIESFRVSEAEIKDASESVDKKFLEVMKEAAKNIYEFHERQRRVGYTINKDGITMGQRITPLDTVGVYIPGGTAAYPSTVLMDVIPAKIAGVKRIVMTSPPQPDGNISSVILAAASIAGVDEVYKVGGAQAIAALAYGTESIPAVDKIVGPGNIYVATAKRLVFGIVGIDMIAGPSDILVIADKTANPQYVAADLLSQAEHGEDSVVVLVTDNEEIAEAVQNKINLQIETLKRNSIAKEAIKRNGKIILIESINEAIKITNSIAPEHLELCVENPFEILEKIKNAGSIFLGHYTPEPLGDYFAGPNHTLPTMGTARFSSPLGVDDFIKRSSFLSYSDKALLNDGWKVEMFAEKEGLEAHAKSISIRTKGEKDV